MRKPKHPLSRAEITEIVKRMVKEDEYQARRDIMLFYKVFTLTPDPAFWKAYELPFQLNCVAWLLSEDGQAHIKTAVQIFHLDLSPEPQAVLSSDKVGADLPIARPKRSVASLFKPLDHEQTK